jgi:ATP-dependent Clp protease ATP-binding subunit ClpX
LVRILTEPKDALVRQYQRMFQLEGGRLEFTPDGLAAIAQRALRRATGARALRSVLEEVLLEAMFDLPSAGGGTWRVDAQAVHSGLTRWLASRSSSAA